MRQGRGVNLKVESHGHQKNILVCVTSPGDLCEEAGEERSLSKAVNSHMLFFFFFETPNQHLGCEHFTLEDACIYRDPGTIEANGECPGLGPRIMPSHNHSKQPSVFPGISDSFRSILMFLFPPFPLALILGE